MRLRGRALVLDGHCRAAIETTQSLGRAGLEVDVACAEPDCLAFRSRYVRRRVEQVSSVRSDAFAAWLRELDRASDYGLIVPASEAALRGVGGLPDGDPLRAKAALAPADSLEVCLDKARTADLAKSLGIPAPAWFRLDAGDRIADSEAFPVVLKPIRSKAVVDGRLTTLEVVIARTEAERRAHLTTMLRHTPVLQQRFVPGRGIGIGLLYDHGRCVWHFTHERVHEMPLTGGASTYRRSVAPPREWLEAARALLDALDWHGVAMVELRVHSNGEFWLMEINPRLWGSLALAIDSGVDFPVGLWRLAQGLTLPAQPAVRLGHYARSLAEDVDWLKANTRADPVDPLLLTRPRLASFAELLRPLLGRESWDHFDLRDPAVGWAVLKRCASNQLGALSRRLGRPRRDAGATS